MMDDTKIVDKLLKAEEEANQKIKEAQRDREKKIREAKIAAEQEIQQYRKEEQEKFEGQISKVGTKTLDQEHQEEELQKEINQIYVDFGKKKQRVVDMLIDRIMSVKLQIPLVLTEQFD